jgi:hypothetical protein
MESYATPPKRRGSRRSAGYLSLSASEAATIHRHALLHQGVRLSAKHEPTCTRARDDAPLPTNARFLPAAEFNGRPTSNSPAEAALYHLHAMHNIAAMAALVTVAPNDGINVRFRCSTQQFRQRNIAFYV